MGNKLKSSIRELFLFVQMLTLSISKSASILIYKNKDICKKKLILLFNISRVLILISFLVLNFSATRVVAETDDNEAQENSLKVPQPVGDPKTIEEAVEFAANATGVNKDFLMGMLEVESDLGRNPGKCTYGEVEQGAQDAHAKGRLSDRAWQTFQDRRDTMQQVAQSLHYDYEKLPVSCNPDTYAGTGGAMGVPQFMPDIWMDYKDKIATIVGKDNPDPWNVKDGAVAMALLVADTPGVTEHNIWAERNAAKMYLSGTTSSQYEWYANQIIYWSHNYQSLLES